MGLVNEPIQINFSTHKAVSYKDMYEIARSIFDDFEREVTSMKFKGFVDTPDINFIDDIYKFINTKKNEAPAFDCEKGILFEGHSIEWLENDGVAEYRLAMAFIIDPTKEASTSIFVSSEVFEKSPEGRMKQLAACGRHILNAVPHSSGFVIPDVPTRFISRYPEAEMLGQDEFPNITQDAYDRFSKELLWFDRLARPTIRMIEQGLFRNVYPYNFVCEAQLSTLKMLFEYDNYPKLSPNEEDRLNRRIKSLRREHRPKLPGQLIDLGWHAALWYVPEHEREMAFNVLSAANSTLYRFYIDHNDLFPKQYS
ncbi:hypothetical protein [Polycladidibacter stylochi]|uniref:hypothetical protein n=1 Tax=Polycladidibacter stylochi TaxID=1807766 RepID=UPI00082B4F22|nr:hypothetical protein [Pseudovibrio stylochi]